MQQKVDQYGHGNWNLLADYIRKTLPGIDLVRNIDPYNGEMMKVITPDQIRNYSEAFIDSIFSEISDLVEAKKKVRITIPIIGGIHGYWQLIKRFKSNPHLLGNVEFVFATKNGNGKNQYNLSEQSEMFFDVSILVDDILDTQGSSINIGNQITNVGEKRKRFQSSKILRDTIWQPHKKFIFPETWLATGFGMNSSIGDPAIFTNPLLIKRVKEIELYERLCALPIAQLFKLEVENWTETEIQAYIELLKAYPYYEESSNDYVQLRKIIEVLQCADNYDQKLKLIVRINQSLIEQIINQESMNEELVILEKEDLLAEG